MARIMLLESGLSKGFQAEAVNTACYIQNRVFLRLILKKAPYELWKGRKFNISYFDVFGSECFILNTKDKLSKFDPKFDLRVFLGYSFVSKAYRVYNKKTQTVEKTIHIIFMEKRNDINQKVAYMEEEIENMSLNDNAQYRQNLQIATRDDDDDVFDPLLINMFLMIFLKIQKVHPSSKDTLV